MLLPTRGFYGDYGSITGAMRVCFLYSSGRYPGEAFGLVTWVLSLGAPPYFFLRDTLISYQRFLTVPHRFLTCIPIGYYPSGLVQGLVQGSVQGSYGFRDR